MSYQVLARKWRPKGFEEVVGQDHVVRALSNAIEQNRMHHAYMFTGTRGVGKTTIARILAKCLNCEMGTTSQPCEQCEACLAVNEGRFVDLIEVDGASRTKVEDTRELLDNVQYAPVQGRIKIYLIDEVHMLSTHSFNALLKTLEEPPAHVKFLLATTDPQKVPITILSRCLQFTLKQLTPEMIADHLAKVLAAESVAFEPAALQALSKAARGSARDALSLTDQAIAYGGGEVKQAQVQAMLGTVHQQALVQVLNALSSQDPATVLEIVEVLVRDGVDIQQLIQDLLGALHRLTLAKSVPALLNQADEADQAWLQLAHKFSPEALQVYYQIALLGMRDLSWAPDMRAAVEMLLLRMMLFDLQAPSDISSATGDASDGGPTADPKVPVDSPAGAIGGMTNEGITNNATDHEGSAGQGERTASAAVSCAAPVPSSHSKAGDVGAITVGAVTEPSARLVEAARASASPHNISPPTVSSEKAASGDVAMPADVGADDDEAHSADALRVDALHADTSSVKAEMAPNKSSAGKGSMADHADDQLSSVPAPTAKAQPPAAGDLPAWLALIEGAINSDYALAGPALNLARNCVVSQLSGSTLYLSIAPNLKMLLTENAQQRLREALIALLPEQLTQVKIQVDTHQLCTPADWIKQQAALALEHAHKALQADAFVQNIQTMFSATLVPDSLKPLKALSSDEVNDEVNDAAVPQAGEPQAGGAGPTDGLPGELGGQWHANAAGPLGAGQPV